MALVRRHLPAFLERLEQDGTGLPRFVTDELQAFITCGDFEHGFLLTACRRCGEQLRVQATGTQLQCLAVSDRVVFAGSARELAPSLREAADWLAPPQGFLQPLRR